MTILHSATAAMVKLHALTTSFSNGSTPDAYSVLGIQSDLVDLYRQVGDEMASKFGAKESAYLCRKIEEAKQYQKGRLDPAKKIADVTQEALLAVGDEMNREIEAATEYKSYRTMLRSIQNALDYSRSVVSFVKTAESSPLPS